MHSQSTNTDTKANKAFEFGSTIRLLDSQFNDIKTFRIGEPSSFQLSGFPDQPFEFTVFDDNGFRSSFKGEGEETFTVFFPKRTKQVTATFVNLPTDEAYSVQFFAEDFQPGN